MFWKKKHKKRPGEGLPASFQGWPETEKIPNWSVSGKPCIEVCATYLSPGRAQLADFATAVFGLIIAGDMIVLSVAVEKLEFFIPAMVGVALFWIISRKFFFWLFNKVILVRFFEDRVEVAGRRWFAEYKIKVGCLFKLKDHERAPDEELRLRRNTQQGRGYFLNSNYVVLEHAYQDIVLACVYPKSNAEALVNRLRGIQDGFSIGLFN